MLPETDQERAGPAVDASRPPLAWPDKPEALAVGSGSRRDRLRMLQQMREYWNQANAARNSLVAEELVHARARQAEAHAYWGTHKAAVKARWKSRTGLRSA